MQSMERINIQQYDIDSLQYTYTIKVVHQHCGEHE